MANMLLVITIAQTGVPQQISASLPANTGGQGNAAFDPGSVYAQQLLFQNQSASNPMMLGDATVTSTRGLQLTPSGSANFGAFINYGTYLSDWWVVGTAGDKLVLLYIK